MSSIDPPAAPVQCSSMRAFPKTLSQSPAVHDRSLNRGLRRRSYQIQYDFPVAGVLLFPDSKIVRAFKRAVSKAKIAGSGDIHMKHFPHQGTARLCNRLTNGGPSHNREVVVAIEAGRERAKARSASIRP